METAELQETVDAVKGLEPAAQVAAIQATIPAPEAATANELWKYLVIGLLALVGVALVGLVVLLVDGKSADTVLTAFSALLTGLIGLFIPSPIGGAK